MKEKICISCSTVFIKTSNNQKYCLNCKNKRNKDAEKRRKETFIPNCVCDNCNKNYYIKPHQIKRSKNHFCSNECRDLYRTNFLYAEMSKKVNMDFKEWLEIKYCFEFKTTREISLILYGNKNSFSSVLNFMHKFNIKIRNKSESIKAGWKEERKEISRNVAIKYLQTKENRDKLKEIMKTEQYKTKCRLSKIGNKNGMYGIVGSKNVKRNKNISEKIRVNKRLTFENHRWIKELIINSSNNCMVCNCEFNNIVKKNTHHLYSYMSFPDLRFDINNGVVICKKCHVEFHKLYGFGNNTKEQFEIFVNNYLD